MNYIVSMLSPTEWFGREDSTSTLKIETLIHTDEKTITTKVSCEIPWPHSNNYSKEFMALFKFKYG